MKKSIISVATKVALMIAILAAVPLAHAKITVTSLDDSGPGSLRQAIADAPSGETIDFSATGTLSLTSQELVIDKNLVISGPGVANLTLSGVGARRVFRVVTGGVVISGLTLANGFTSSKGGLVINGGTLTIDQCKLVHGTAGGADSDGGGIYNVGALTVRDSTITGCHAENIGGAVCDAYSGSPTTVLSGCTIYGNRPIKVPLSTSVTAAA